MSNLSAKLRLIQQVIKETQRGRVIKCQFYDLCQLSDTNLIYQDRFRLNPEQIRQYEKELVELLSVDYKKLEQLRAKYYQIGLGERENKIHNDQQILQTKIVNAFPTIPIEFIKHLKVEFEETTALRTPEEYGGISIKYDHPTEIDNLYPSEYSMNFIISYDNVPFFETNFYCDQTIIIDEEQQLIYFDDLTNE